MGIVLTAHALLKLHQRNISQELVLKTVQFPNFTKPTRDLREEQKNMSDILPS